MELTSSADVRIRLFGHIETVLHTEPVMRTLMKCVGVSTVFHQIVNTASQRKVIY